MSLSEPTLFSPSDLRTNTALLTQLVSFINKSFHTSHAREPDDWDPSINRFDSTDEVLEMLGDQGIMCLIFDTSSSTTSNFPPNTHSSDEGKIVACGGAIPWTWSKWENSGGGEESDSRDSGKKKDAEGAWDWEVKIVCTEWDEKYARTGLAVRVVDRVQEYLCERLRARVGEERGMLGLGRELAGTASEKGGKHVQKEERRLKLWVVTKESLVGAYWKRRGYIEVRRKMAGPGTWGCEVGFEMLLMKKEVQV